MTYATTFGRAGMVYGMDDDKEYEADDPVVPDDDSYVWTFVGSTFDSVNQRVLWFWRGE